MKLVNLSPLRQRPTERKKVRAADAKEVGVGNPAEETCRYPNQILIQLRTLPGFVNAQKFRKIALRGVGDSLTTRRHPQKAHEGCFQSSLPSGAHLDTTANGKIGPLSLSLSPLRGARELGICVVAP